MQITRKTQHQGLITAGTDSVVAACPLPPGGKLTRMAIQCSLTVPALAGITILQAVQYGAHAYVVPVLDPDEGLSYNAAWDALVPKDEPSGTDLDIDTSTPDASPVSEPGRIDVNAIFGMVGQAPREFYRREKLLTFAEIGPVVGSQAVDTWTPSDYFKLDMRPMLETMQHSYAMFAISNPLTTSTTATIWPPPLSEQEWAMLQFTDQFLELMFIKGLEMVEAGAETPYDTAEEFITRLLEELPFEQTAGAFDPTSWNVFTKAMWQFTTPGRPSFGGSIGSG